jgi:hypothetical protein
VAKHTLKQASKTAISFSVRMLGSRSEVWPLGVQADIDVDQVIDDFSEFGDDVWHFGTQAAEDAGEATGDFLQDAGEVAGDEVAGAGEFHREATGAERGAWWTPSPACSAHNYWCANENGDAEDLHRYVRSERVTVWLPQTSGRHFQGPKDPTAPTPRSGIIGFLIGITTLNTALLAQPGSLARKDTQ